ncbi:hypothetical protein Tco_0191598 [Tanacetum coccineum]
MIATSSRTGSKKPSGLILPPLVYWKPLPLWKILKDIKRISASQANNWATKSILRSYHRHSPDNPEASAVPESNSYITECFYSSCSLLGFLPLETTPRIFKDEISVRASLSQGEKELLSNISAMEWQTLDELGRRMTEFTTRVRQDTNKIYMRLDDEQTERQLMAGLLNILYRDRRAHAHTTRLIEAEARISREAWG